jgi:hypothetical protein
MQGGEEGGGSYAEAVLGGEYICLLFIYMQQPPLYVGAEHLDLRR